jgi:hypothetical protein
MELFRQMLGVVADEADGGRRFLARTTTGSVKRRLALTM